MSILFLLVLGGCFHVVLRGSLDIVFGGYFDIDGMNVVGLLRVERNYSETAPDVPGLTVLRVSVVTCKPVEGLVRLSSSMCSSVVLSQAKAGRTNPRLSPCASESSSVYLYRVGAIIHAPAHHAY